MGAKNKLEILILIILIQTAAFENAKAICGHDSKNNPKIKEELIKSKRNLLTNPNYDLNIVFDLTYVEEGITKYNLAAYRSIIINSFYNVAQTLKSLLKVVERRCYYIYSYDFDDYGFDNWNKAKFGITSFHNYFKTCDYNIDLFILSRFYDSDELIEYKDSNLLISKILYVGSQTGQPVSGHILLNQKAILSNINKKNLEEYFKYLLLHHFIHLLGFQNFVINNFFSSYLYQETKRGVKRTYIKSSKVVNVAKKYFNCSEIKGVELEDQDSTIHWESKILLGEIMTVSPFEPEQVISEFTLAFLEDTGYYFANYYTGGLMQFGRNKGCKFINEKCIQNYKVDPKFENEFYSFESFKSKKDGDASCSSARQSRTYFARWLYSSKIPSYYQYFKNSSFGGYSYADYCPVAENIYKESDKFYYIGRCNKMGIGDYGKFINNYLDNLNYTNGILEKITGETYSENSYCYQSSLYKDNEPKKYYYSNTVRAICYESYCSSKSLTIKIHDNYIVCPRQGGKISAIGFVGYFLCPDYYLICSGKVLCNDMFDCVSKKSEIKAESYYRDYEPKTSQNLIRAESEKIDNENNYELSNDGICTKYCKQCSENKKCIKCRNNYILLGNKGNEEIICTNSSQINDGYYKDENTSVYYKCGENCEKCLNDINCIKCKDNYAKINNLNNSCFSIDELIPYYIKDPKDESNFLSCGRIYDHCLTCNNIKCLSCENGYSFIDDTFKDCKKDILLSSSYYLENNIEEDEEKNIENNNLESQIRSKGEYYEEVKEENEDDYLKEENENKEIYEDNNDQENYNQNKEKNIEELKEENELEYKEKNKEIYAKNNEEEYYEETNIEILEEKKEEEYNKENIEKNNEKFEENSEEEYYKEIYEEEYKENIRDENNSEELENNGENLNEKEIYEENEEKNSEENKRENYYDFPEEKSSYFIEEENNLKETGKYIEYFSEENKENNEETNSYENNEKFEEEIKENNEDEEAETKENNEKNYERKFETFELNEHEKNFEFFEEENNNEKEIGEKINSIEDLLTKEVEISGENEINNKEIYFTDLFEDHLEENKEDFEKEESEENHDEDDINSTQKEIESSFNEMSSNYIQENSSYSPSENHETQNITNEYIDKTESNIINKHSYSIFIFQAILKDNQIHLFIISEPNSQGIKYLLLKVIIEKKGRLRNLNQQEVILKAVKNNKSFNRLEDFATNLENLNITDDTIIQIENITIEQNDNDDIYNINYPSNRDNLNTKKVQNLISNGGINFFDIYSEANYKINLYKIQERSTGCEFDLITNNKITSDKNIKLSFTEVQKSSNIIDIDCSLSSNNNNIIKCKTNQKLNNLYFINDYIYYDNEELFILFNDDKTVNYNLLCEEDSFNSDKEPFSTTDDYNVEPIPNTEEFNKPIQYSKNSGSISTGMIIGLIVGGIIILGSIILASICIYKKCHKKDDDSDSLSEFTESETDISGNSKFGVNEDSPKKKITFKTSTQITNDIFIKPNKTIKDLLKLYSKIVKQPNIYKDGKICFLHNATPIKKNSKKLISEYFDFNNVIIIIVIDPERKIKRPQLI